MAKKTIIITEQQLMEINGTSTEYLDGIGNGTSEYLDNEVMATSKIGNGENGAPNQTDKYSKQLSRQNNVLGYSKQMSPNGSAVLTCSFGEWKEKNHINETNSDLYHRTFKDVNDNNISYSNMTYKISNLNDLKEKMGDNFHGTPQEKELDNLENQYKVAKGNSKSVRDTKMKLGLPVLKSKPKQSGNGKAHTQKPNNGRITTNNYF